MLNHLSGHIDRRDNVSTGSPRFNDLYGAAVTFTGHPPVSRLQLDGVVFFRFHVQRIHLGSQHSNREHDLNK